MSFTDKYEEVVGVVVARFQTPALHEGHRYILDYALSRHDDVLVILGVSPVMTDRNPLSFEMRKGMLENAYPGMLTIVPSDSLPSSYKERSQKIDEIIKTIYPHRGAVLYGSRESFVHTYEGSFKTEEVPTIFSGNATEIRKSVKIIDSEDFRSGVVHANIHRKRVGYPTVDVAVVHYPSQQVLLVGKNSEEGKLRFPGVFFNPEVDDSFESAGIRCVRKETPQANINTPQYVESKRIDDWRFNKAKDSLVSILMKAECMSGSAVPGKGVDTAAWVPFSKVPEVLIASHQPLGEIMQKHWY